ncbi:MAG: hypothetical protein K2N30_01085 [Clostridia bacterium]|nr:hypothetical protein [Clostridia bacterium]
MARMKKKTTTTVKKTKSKKYESLSTTGLECLNCTLPAHVCCGIPKQCKAKYAKYLERKAKEEQNQRTRRRKNVSA